MDVRTNSPLSSQYLLAFTYTDFLQSSAMTLLNIALLELSNATQGSELLAAFIASCSRILADVQRIYEQSLVVAELNALELQLSLIHI